MLVNLYSTSSYTSDTAPSVRKSLAKLIRAHSALEKAKVEFDNAIQVRYGISLQEAADSDLDAIIEIADYGMACDIKNLDDAMGKSGYEVYRRA